MISSYLFYRISGISTGYLCNPILKNRFRFQSDGLRDEVQPVGRLEEVLCSRGADARGTGEHVKHA